MANTLTPQQIREAELPRARRGLDEEATRRFLADAAGTLSAVTRERDDLRRAVKELSAKVAQNPTDAETIGAVLLTANRVGEDLVAKATEEATAIVEEAVSERENLFVRAQGETDAMIAGAAATIESLRGEEEELRRSISQHRQELVTFLRSALTQLEDVESVSSGTAEPPELDGELLARVPSE